MVSDGVGEVAATLTRAVADGGLGQRLLIDLGDAGCLLLDGTNVYTERGSADTVVTTTLAVMREVVAGRTDLVLAYYEGQADILGSQNLALTLSELLETRLGLQRVQRFDGTGLSAAGGAVDVTEVAAALNETGAVVVDDCVPQEVVAQVAAELRPHFDRFGHEYYADFEGYKTLRLSEILARSATSAELIAEAVTLAVADQILLPSCINYRIGSCTGIEILPGEAQQVLHRDDGIYPIAIQGMELQISAMWALTEFTVENGATHVIPGSHRGPPRNVSHQPEHTLQVPMRPGSVLFYLGSVLHGGGANLSDAPRMGLVNTYSLGWLRQEENHYLAIDRKLAEGMPERVRELMGYTPHGPILGTYPDQPHDGTL